MDINISDFDYEIRKYNIKNHSGAQNWIPCLILILPFSKSQVENQTLYVKGIDPYNFFFKGNQIGLSIDLPFWSYTNPDLTLGRTFLEVYQDDYILFTVNINSIKYFDFHLTIKVDDTVICDSSKTHSNDPGCYMLLPMFVRTSDGFYLNTNLNIGGAETSSQSFEDIKALPFENTNKGILNTDQFDFQFTTQLNGNINGAIDSATKKFLKDTKKYDGNDPNGGGGDSTGGGGGGSGDIGGKPISGGGHPTISPLDSGLITCYSPSVGELQALGRFLWSKNFSVDDFKKLFNDPFDTLLGLSIIPIKPTISKTQSIMFGNLDSGVVASVVSDPWVDVNCGSFTLNEVWRGALDYAPATGISIYLPFIGTRELNTNDVMGSTLTLKYHFDVLTGGCLAEIFVDHTSQGNKSDGFSYNKDMGKVYEFSGQCSVPVPLASQDFTNTIRGMISAIGMVGGIGASVATGNPALGVMSGIMGTAQLGVQASTPTVQRSGSLGCSASFMAGLEPGLIVQRPHQCKPSRYYSLRGVPSQVYTSKLSDCTGFTQITRNNNIHCSGAEDSELEEIQNLLVEGVYFPSKAR